MSIGNLAFYRCYALATLRLPSDPPGLGAFPAFMDTYDSGNPAATLTIKVPSTPPGVVTAYKTAWGVDEDPPANGNAGKYGNNHKRIVITDTP
jgi:hypothetical protein